VGSQMLQEMQEVSEKLCEMIAQQEKEALLTSEGAATSAKTYALDMSNSTGHYPKGSLQNFTAPKQIFDMTKANSPELIPLETVRLGRAGDLIGQGQVLEASLGNNPYRHCLACRVRKCFLKWPHLHLSTRPPSLVEL